MKHIRIVGYEEWREVARPLLQSHAAPDDLVWEDSANRQSSLLEMYDRL